MELHFMFVLRRGAVGRILSLSPPTLSLALTPSPPACLGCRGGSEQSLACSALPGLPQEQVFPSSMSPARDRCPPLFWEVQGCAKGPCPKGQPPPYTLPISAPPRSPIVVLLMGVWLLKPSACLGVRMGDSR